MRNLILILVFLIGGFQSSLYADAVEDDYEIVVGEESDGSGDDSDSSDDNVKHHPDENPFKSSQMHLVFTISKNKGVLMNGSNISGQIISFEIFDENGFLIASFSNERSFIEFTFSSLTETYFIRFHLTSGKIMKGWLYCE